MDGLPKAGNACHSATHHQLMPKPLINARSRGLCACVGLGLCGLAAVFALTGCGTISIETGAVEPMRVEAPPLSPEDRALQYMALAEAARIGTVGASMIWANEDSGRWGKYTITKVNAVPHDPGATRYGRRPYGIQGGRYDPGPLSSIEVTEEVYSDGREFIATGLGFHRLSGTRWYRYK
jgi:hypothetical protein